jgi:hypothetical protein
MTFIIKLLDGLLECLGSDQSKSLLVRLMMGYAHQSAYKMQRLWQQVVFVSQLCWKIVLGTTKIANHPRRSKRCNWYLLPCCVLSLSEGCFMIGVYTSLANYILHFVDAIDVS